MKNIGVGILGCGFIANGKHLLGMQRRDDLEVAPSATWISIGRGTQPRSTVRLRRWSAWTITTSWLAMTSTWSMPPPQQHAEIMLPVTWKTPKAYWGATHVKQLENFYASPKEGKRCASDAWRWQEGATGNLVGGRDRS